MKNIKNKIGMNWRIPLYHRWLFYVSNFSNYKEIILYEQNRQCLAQLKTRNGMTVYFDEPGHTLRIVSDIWFHRSYTKYYPHNNPKVIVDIGANIGLFTLYAEQIWPSSTIFAYEPSQANYQLLSKNINGLIPKRISIFNVAVSDRKGFERLFIKSKNGWHSLYEEKDVNHETEVVRTIDLETVFSYCPDQIDFLKIDCEGCEWRLITKANLDIISGSVNYLAMEYHELSGMCHKNLVYLLESANFHVLLRPSAIAGLGMLYAANKKKFLTAPWKK